MFALATIVEGPGDVAALPVLLRRLRPEWTILRPIRLARSKLIPASASELQLDVLNRYVQTANAAIAERKMEGAILLVYDADDDCAKDLGQRLREAARSRTAHRCQAVIAVREFEAWFLAGGCIAWAGNADSPRDAKGAVRQALGIYSETTDQPRLAQLLDVEAARTSRSFRQLLIALDRLAPSTPSETSTPPSSRPA